MTIDVRGIADGVRAAAVGRGGGVVQVLRRAFVMTLDLRAADDRMATLAADLVARLTPLRQMKAEQARPCRTRLEAADAEISRHLDRASVLFERPERL